MTSLNHHDEYSVGLFFFVLGLFINKFQEFSWVKGLGVEGLLLMFLFI